MKLVNRDYYTLEELIKRCEGSVSDNYYLGQDVTKGFIHCIMAVYNIGSEGSIGAELSSTEANTLWCRYIVPYHMHEYIVFRDNGQVIGDSEPTAEEFKRWINGYCAIFNRTYNKYKTLIDNYTSAKDSLMNDISQSTTTRFNDTPQNGGDFSSDSYTTNYTKSETTTPVSTKMARLEEIRLG